MTTENRRKKKQEKKYNIGRIIRMKMKKIEVANVLKERCYTIYIKILLHKDLMKNRLIICIEQVVTVVGINL